MNHLRLFSVLTFCLVLNLGQAQTEAKTFLISGSTLIGGSNSPVLGFNSGKTVISNSLDNEKSSIKEWSYNFHPSLAYFIIKDFAVGASIGLAGGKSVSDLFSFEDKTLGFTPFLRYYLPITGKIKPFIEANGSINSVKSKSDTDTKFDQTNFKGFGAAAGAAVFVSQKFSLDLFVKYDRMSGNDSEELFGEKVETKYVISQFTVGIGMSFFL